MPCVCSSNGVKSITSRMGPRRKYGIICAKSGSHVFSVSILSLLKNRSNRRSMLLAFASLSANSSSATCGITILLALIAPNTNSASVLLWCPCNCVKNCLTCSCQTWHNGLNASIEIVFFHLDFGFCSILTISCVLRFSFSSNVSLLSRWSGLFHSLYSSFAIYCSLYMTKKGSVGEALQTATLLPGGQVLVAGGFDLSGNPVATAELFTPGLTVIAQNITVFLGNTFSGQIAFGALFGITGPFSATIDSGDVAPTTTVPDTVTT